MARRIDLRPGQVWVTRRSKPTATPSRRIVAIAARRGFGIQDRIWYSAGGDTRTCLRSAFLQWLRTYGAKATRTRRTRTLKLR